MPWADEDGACATSPCCIPQLKSNCGGKLSVDKSMEETNQECSLALQKFPHTQEKLEAA